MMLPALSPPAWPASGLQPRALGSPWFGIGGGSRRLALRTIQMNPYGPYEAWAGYLSSQVYYAAARGQQGALCKLLTEGANPDWYNPEDGLTPLQIAALKGRAECVHRLLVAGADIFATGAQVTLT